MTKALGLLMSLALVLASGASAAEYLVKPDGTGDFPTIQDAVNAAMDGDLIKLQKGTYLGDGNRDIEFFGKAITVKGKKNKPLEVVINPEGTPEEPHRAFWFRNGETVDAVLEGVTITGGYAPGAQTAVVGGAISFIGSSATVRNCVFRENVGEIGGGAVSVYESAPVFTDCLFENNESLVYVGGAIVGAAYSYPVFQRCDFLGNIGGQWGGAIGIIIGAVYDDPTVYTLIDCHFEGNSATTQGGAVWFNHGTSLDATGCTFVGNSAEEGGAVFLGANSQGEIPDLSQMWITDCTFAENLATSGGAILTTGTGGHVNISGSTFYGNSAQNGGNLWVTADPVVTTIERSVLAFSLDGASIGGVGGMEVTLMCSDVFGNAGGDYVGPIAGMDGVDGNFSADPLFCDSMNLDLTLAEDSPCLPEESGCGLVGAWPEGCRASEDGDGDRLADPSLDQPPSLLGPARPNPFTGSTQVSYTLLESQEITLAVYDVMGRKVATLVSGVRSAGDHAVAWAGLDDRGRKVEPGMYFTRLDAGAVTESKGLVLTR